MVGEKLVRGEQSVLAVHDEGDGGCLAHGGLDLAQYLLLEAPYAVRAFLHGKAVVKRDAAGVDDAVFGLAGTAHDAFHAVPRDAGAVVGDRPVAAYQPVEEGGLAHVGASNENDVGKQAWHGAVLSLVVCRERFL